MASRVVVELPTSSGQLVNTAGCLLLHATRETTGGAAAVYHLYDGSGTGGKLLLPVALSAGQSTRDSFMPHALPFKQGLWFNLDSGLVEGDVSVFLDHDCDVFWAEAYDLLHAAAGT